MKTNSKDESGRDESGRGSVEQLLRSILDLTVSMERGAESEDFEKVTDLMGRRESLLGEYSGLHHPGKQDSPTMDLIRAIDRENAILMVQLQQKRDLIAGRIQNMQNERAIAHYRQ